MTRTIALRYWSRMGAWGSGAFDNDAAYDWSSNLTDTDPGDLSFVEETLSTVEDAEDDELDLDLACEAIAACEVVARLQGRGGRAGAHLSELDSWVRQHTTKPSPALVRLAANVLDRVAANSSELSVLPDSSVWLSSVQDLRKRVTG